MTSQQIPCSPEDYQVPYHERSSFIVPNGAQVSWILSLAAPPITLAYSLGISHLEALTSGRPAPHLGGERWQPRSPPPPGGRDRTERSGRPCPRGESHR